MFKILILAVTVVLASSEKCTSIPHGHQLTQFVDNGFNIIDTDNDGILSTTELTAVWDKEDMNDDGKLTLAEYAAAWNTTPEFLGPIFHVWDQDGDGLVPAQELGKYFHYMDPDGNGSVSLHDYEHYMTGFMECAYCHGQHGHGPNCDQ